MNTNRRRGAFTLIEVLIVVVIMAVLAATIIPQFTSSTKDAKESTAKFNLHTLKSQLELYRLHHNGSFPAATNNLEQLTKASDAAGAVTMSGAPDSTHPFGPYIQKIPANPFNSKLTVRADTGMAGTTPSATGADGWIYRASTGEIWIDDATYISMF